MKGGMENILRMIWTAVIEDFRSLQPFLTFVTSNDVSEDEMAAFHRLFGTDSSPEGLFIRFLSGTGIPDENKWAEITREGLLQDIPSREDMCKPSFRPRMFTLAMTGSLHLPKSSMQVSNALFVLCCLLTPVQITFVSQNNDGHSGNDINRESIFQPLVEFKTCFKTASVPLFYFLKLGHGEERFKAIDTWLLFEILNAIGGYSIM